MSLAFAGILAVSCNKESTAAYTVTVGSSGNGTASANLAEAEEGATVTLTATADADYIFKQWIVVGGGVTLSDAAKNPVTFTMPSGPVEVKAEFVLRTVKMTDDGGGTATADPADATAGQTVTITATPASENYKFRQWTVIGGGMVLSPEATANPATFIMPAGQVEIKAEFSLTTNGIANAATLTYDAAGSDPTKTVYNFTFPAEVAGAQITSATVSSTTATSVTTDIASSLAGNTLTIASAEMESASGTEITVKYTITFEGAASSAVSKTVPFTGVAKNDVGGVYYESGVWQGVVLRAKTGNTVATRGLVLHKDRSGYLEWSKSYETTGTADLDDGLANMAIIAGIENWATNYPAFAFVNGKNPANIVYVAGMTGIWYLPAQNELLEVFDASPEVNTVIQANNGTVYSSSTYWSSSEDLENAAIAVFGSVTHSHLKVNAYYVRSVLAF